MSDNLQHGQLKVTNAVGMELLLAFNTIDEAYDRMRFMGSRGWSTGPAPAGGFTLPYAMAETFDFSLIGAREFTMTIDGAETRCLEHRGQIYKRREEAAVNKPSKKMPAKIWYSRGAKATDGSTKDDEGAISYVCLIQFVGGGRSIAEFEKPRRAPQQQQPQPAQSQQQAQPAARPAEAAPPGDPLDQDLGHRGARGPKPVGIETLLMNLDAGVTRAVLALAKAKRVDDVRLAVLIAKLSGANTPLQPDQVDQLKDLLRAETVAA